MGLRLCFISDTHCLHSKLEIPECDILFFTGDATRYGNRQEVFGFFHWLDRQYQCLYKVIIWGNHDRHGESKYNINTGADRWYQPIADKFGVNQRDGSIIHLHNSSINLLGLNIWGSPVSPDFYPDSWAFNMPRGERIAMLWDTIPEGTDIVLTHTPPYGMLDYIPSSDERVGCEELSSRILTVKPKIHAFGHIHEGYGMYETINTLFINASSCNEHYKIVNKPICLEL